MKIQDVMEVQRECERFLKRLHAFKKRNLEDSYAINGCKESGALKRAALDLKNELTKLNQSRYD